MSCMSSTSLPNMDSLPEASSDTQESWAREPTSSKYGGLSPLGITSTRKVNSYPSSLRKSKRCCESWDNDFELDSHTSLHIPSSLQASSDVLDIDIRNIRLLSRRSQDLKNALKEVMLKQSRYPKRASEALGTEYISLLEEAEVMVKLVAEVSDINLRKNTSEVNFSEYAEARVKSIRLLKYILYRTRPPSPVTPDDPNDRPASQPESFDFTSDLVPPLLDQIEELILRLTSYSELLGP
ncbi:hypothetical protein DSO57_1021704 [Entomophthora muscae]|uniref:Uncharacterized protein n=1 Tax=Entomophthora muscae TaxID=34485 RepID=A0ACC2TED3_9FUNG|nr:hypothetical protein DSO57_1021704 [Entomophthora muscae]